METIQYSKVTEEAIEDLGFSTEEAKELLVQHKDEEVDV